VYIRKVKFLSYALDANHDLNFMKKKSEVHKQMEGLDGD
jgi:hypothetical protein